MTAVTSSVDIKSLLGVHPDFPQKGKQTIFFLSYLTSLFCPILVQLSLTFAYLQFSIGLLLIPFPEWLNWKIGIIFLDIFPILQDPVAFESLLTTLLHHVFSVTIPNSVSKKVDVVVGLDARLVCSSALTNYWLDFLVFFYWLIIRCLIWYLRGFLLGPILALRLGAAFVPVRKVGKLPGKCVKVTYEKEYGSVSFFISLRT